VSLGVLAAASAESRTEQHGDDLPLRQQLLLAQQIGFRAGVSTRPAWHGAVQAQLLVKTTLSCFGGKICQ
jgi:hypothetical protein